MGWRLGELIGEHGVPGAQVALLSCGNVQDEVAGVLSARTRIEVTRDSSVSAHVDRASTSPVLGTGFTYSNSGFVVIGRLVEVVSGQAFHDVLKERLMRPLQIDEPGLAAMREDQGVEVPDLGNGAVGWGLGWMRFRDGVGHTGVSKGQKAFLHVDAAAGGGRADQPA
ncbi:serine hydrolase [Lentzea sp. NPDC058450]|uniref:serine hydrolase n=1 Tax=Lentzea sp. NPDC058450 TaxID=3346505 RepID=UPI003653CB13